MMLTVRNYNLKLFGIVCLEGILFFIIYIAKFNIPCFLESNFNIPCLSCYMTASFDCLLKGDLFGFLSCNTFTIFVLTIFTVFNTSIMYDAFTGHTKTSEWFNRIMNYPKVIVTIMLSCWLINIVTHICL